jgi:hypothetical protein
LQFTLVVLLREQFASYDELASPGDLFLVLHLLHRLPIHLLALLLVQIRDDVDSLEVLFAEFSAIWSDSPELDAELLVALHVGLVIVLNNLDLNDELSLILLEGGDIFNVFVVLIPPSGMRLSFVKFNGLIIDSYSAIGTVLTDELNQSVLIIGMNLDGALSLLEADVTGLIIIDDRHFTLGVSSRKFLISLPVVQVHGEVTVRVPLLIVVNRDRDDLKSLATFEGNNLVDCIEVSLFTGRLGFASTVAMRTLHSVRFLLLTVTSRTPQASETEYCRQRNPKLGLVSDSASLSACACSSLSFSPFSILMRDLPVMLDVTPLRYLSLVTKPVPSTFFLRSSNETLSILSVPKDFLRKSFMIERFLVSSVLGCLLGSSISFIISL